jgi:hypothetical protein
MEGVSGHAPDVELPASSGGRPLRYRPIEDSTTVEQRLDASLMPPDRSVFEVALKRSLANWVFHVPSTIAVLWLSTVIEDLAVVLSALLGALVLLSLVPAAVTLSLAVPRVLFRPFTKRGRFGYGWFLGTTVMAAVDCAVYGVCIFLLARAAQLDLSLSLSSLPLSLR